MRITAGIFSTIVAAALITPSFSFLLPSSTFTGISNHVKQHAGKTPTRNPSTLGLSGQGFGKPAPEKAPKKKFGKESQPDLFNPDLPYAPPPQNGSSEVAFKVDNDADSDSDADSSQILGQKSSKVDNSADSSQASLISLLKSQIKEAESRIDIEVKGRVDAEKKFMEAEGKIEEEKKGREVSEVETRSEAMRLSETRM